MKYSEYKKLISLFVDVKSCFRRLSLFLIIVSSMHIGFAHAAPIDVDPGAYQGVWRVYGIFMESPISGAYTTGEEAAEIMKLLQEAGADIHARAANGQSVAHGSAKAGWNEALQFAWDQGVDFTIPDVGGYTPRDLAVMLGNDETAAFIDELLGN